MFQSDRPYKPTPKALLLMKIVRSACFVTQPVNRLQVVTWNQVNNPGRSFPPGETLTISRANTNDTGGYNCAASNSAGSSLALAVVTVGRKYAS